MRIQPIVYMETNRPNGTIYTGVTSDLARRHMEHVTGTGSAFCKKYNLTQLVWYEVHPTMQSAITRESYLKDRRRSYKIALIQKMNPEWTDLSSHIQDIRN